MKLEQYMQQNNLTDGGMGKLVGVTSTSIYRYRKGRQRPNDKIIMDIYNRTNGHVTPNDFYEIENTPLKEGGEVKEGGNYE